VWAVVLRGGLSGLGVECRHPRGYVAGQWSEGYSRAHRSRTRLEAACDHSKDALLIGLNIDGRSPYVNFMGQHRRQASLRSSDCPERLGEKQARPV
jgi:hypothetical protein